MKNTITYLISIFCIAALFSCTAILDETSPNDIDAEAAITNADGAENALIGLYSSMRNTSYYGGDYLLIADALGRNATTGGFDNPVLDEVGAQSVTPSNTMIEELWIAIYNVIANANHLIEALPSIDDLDSERRNDIDAQARAIRALAHFDLLRYFGEHWDTASTYGIPIIQTPQSITDIPSRATVAQTYSFIENELNNALANINPESREIPYINEATIHALLSRVYLYEGDYTSAALHATVVIDDATYTLLPPSEYTTIFTARQTSESIFELVFDSQNRSAYNSLTYSREDALRTEVSYLCGPELNEIFMTRPEDVRATLLNYDLDANDESITSDGSGRSQKYRGETTKDNPAFIIRLAEVYLIRAEATGLAGGGLDDLNKLRVGRGLPEIAPADEDELLDAILEERRAELNFEGHIFFDLARTGRITEDLGIDAYRAILPIPLREITASKGSLEQNPGY